MLLRHASPFKKCVQTSAGLHGDVLLVRIELTAPKATPHFAMPCMPMHMHELCAPIADSVGRRHCSPCRGRSSWLALTPTLTVTFRSRPQAKQLARSKGGTTAAGGKQPAPGVSADLPDTTNHYSSDLSTATQPGADKFPLPHCNVSRVDARLPVQPSGRDHVC